jgi:glutaredoxin-like protein NrdH
MSLFVTVYTQPACRQCDATKKKLDELDIPYEVEEISDESRAAAMDLGVMAAPIVAVTIDGVDDQWGGYKPDRIKALVPHVAPRWSAISVPSPATPPDVNTPGGYA